MGGIDYYIRITNTDLVYRSFIFICLIIKFVSENILEHDNENNDP